MSVSIALLLSTLCLVRRILKQMEAINVIMATA